MNLQRAIEGCRKNDPICQKYIYDRYAEGMLLVCVRYVKDLNDAEELMLNGFCNFFRHIGKVVYTNDAGISAWIKKIMVNECLSLLRKKRKMSMVHEKEAQEIASNHDPLAGMGAAQILNIITSLPDGYRTVFNLYAVEGYNHNEIATLLGISEGTSKSQLSKARNMLQQSIKKSEWL